MHEALSTIADNLRAHIADVIDAGADGVFLALQGCTKEMMSVEQYREYGRPYDLIALQGREQRLAEHPPRPRRARPDVRPGARLPGPGAQLVRPPGRPESARGAGADQQVPDGRLARVRRRSRTARRSRSWPRRRTPSPRPAAASSSSPTAAPSPTKPTSAGSNTPAKSSRNWRSSERHFRGYPTSEPPDRRASSRSCRACRGISSVTSANVTLQRRGRRLPN